MGWAKWSFRNCAEWLAWRCGISLSAAREKVRTAQALRNLPAIGAAFADGRLSYSKVRALTRVVEWHDEDSLLEYALRATAAQVEERCRQLRNTRPESANIAQRAWEHRALTLWRDAARGVMRRKVSSSTPMRGARSKPTRSSRSQSPISVAAKERPVRQPIAIRSSCTSTKNPSAEGSVAPIYPWIR